MVVFGVFVFCEVVFWLVWAGEALLALALDCCVAEAEFVAVLEFEAALAVPSVAAGVCGAGCAWSDCCACTFDVPKPTKPKLTTKIANTSFFRRGMINSSTS